MTTAPETLCQLDASRYVPLDNLALSPQCGFASTFEGNLLTEDEQWRKMQLVVDVARQIWGRASREETETAASLRRP